MIIPKLNNNPPSPIEEEDEEFLKTDYTNIQEHAAQLAYIRNKYAQRAAILWGEATAHKYYLKEMECWANNEALKEEGISLERAKWNARSNPEFKKAIKNYIEIEVDRKRIVGYLTSLDFKGNFIPGMQGMLNRELDFENSVEY
jgi:hypothetical protein